MLKKADKKKNARNKSSPQQATFHEIKACQFCH